MNLENMMLREMNQTLIKDKDYDSTCMKYLDQSDS